MPKTPEGSLKVTAVAKGDRVVIPFVISFGNCFFCSMKLPAACEVTNTERGAIPNKKQIPPGAALLVIAIFMAGFRTAIDVIGFEAKGSAIETTLATLKLEGSSCAGLRQCIAAVRLRWNN